VDIAADGRHSQYSADSGERQQAVAFAKKWIDVAAAVGSSSVRTNIPGGERLASPTSHAPLRHCTQ